MRSVTPLLVLITVFSSIVGAAGTPPSAATQQRPSPARIRIVGAASAFNSPCLSRSYDGCRIIAGTLIQVGQVELSFPFAVEREFDAGPCHWRAAWPLGEQDTAGDALAFVEAATRYLNGNRSALLPFAADLDLMTLLARNRATSCR